MQRATNPTNPEAVTREHQPKGSSARLMRVASFASIAVALTLIALKTWAWIETDSVALLSSLADSVLDLVASMVTFVAVKVAVSP